METPTFGSVLRDARERRRLSLTDVADKTKVSVASLQRLEAANLDDLPPEIFVRGFIRSYARSVGMSEGEPLGLLDQAIAARRSDEEILVATPAAPASGAEDDATGARRGIGLAVFVIIVLLIATITVSLFIRQPPPSGEGLSSVTPGDQIEQPAQRHLPT